MTKKKQEHHAHGNFPANAERALADLLAPGDFFSRRLASRLARQIDIDEPFADVFETKDEVVATVELPGVKKEDISLKVSPTCMMLEVQKKQAQERHGEASYEYTARFEGYTRTVPFPSRTISSKSKATYKNGVVEVRAPKDERQEEGGKITID